MEIEKGRVQLARVIDGHRHRDYDRVLEITQLSELINAEKPDDLYTELRRYRSREDKELFAQRIKTQNPSAKALLSPVRSYLSYPGRSDGRRIKVEIADQNKLDLIETNFERFFGEMTLFGYIDDACQYAQMNDPNMWIGFERENYEDDKITKARIYPVEFSGAEVVDFGKYENDRVKYMCAMTEYMEKNAAGSMVAVSSYWFYGPGYVLRAISDDNDPIHTRYDVTGWRRVDFEVKGQPKPFYYNEFQNGTTEVPFAQAGAYRNRPHTCKELLYQDAVGIVRDAIRDLAFVATHKLIHTHPERIEYVKPCEHKNQQQQSCIDGYYNGIRDKAHMCSSCGGTGKAAARMEQESLQLIWPHGATAESIAPLDNMVKYVERPLEPTIYLTEEVQRQALVIFSVTYNQNNVTPTGPARTATEVTIQADLLNNKLMPFARKIEALVELAYRVGAQYYDIVQYDVSCSLGNDYRVLSLDQLISQYQAAKSAGVPHEVLRALEYQLIEKLWPDWPDMREEKLMLMTYKPFQDKGSAEVATILAGRSEDDPARILWENWTQVERLVSEQLRPSGNGPYFHQLNPVRRGEVMAEIVTSILGQIKTPGQINDPALIQP